MLTFSRACAPFLRRQGNGMEQRGLQNRTEQTSIYIFLKCTYVCDNLSYHFYIYIIHIDTIRYDMT